MKPIKTLLLTGLLASSISTSLLAQSEIRNNSPHFGEKGWDVELGLAAYSISDPLYRDEDFEDGGILPIINLSYFDDNFHFVLDGDEGLLLGYTLTRGEDWAADVILSPRFDGPHEDNKTLDFLDERDPDLHLGLRWTHYGHTSRFKLEVSQDISDTHDGVIVSAETQREWQVRNWLLTGTAGFGYMTADGVDYYLGVDPGEANADNPTYEADASWIAGLSLKAEYPINENWVFETTVGSTYLGDEVSDSPITPDNNVISGAIIGARYHF